jgi:restriction endonuclease Mrr
VTSPVYERDGSEFGKRVVDVEYLESVDPPLTRREIAEGRIGPASPFATFMGTNFRIADPSLSEALDDVLKNRLKPIARRLPNSGEIDVQRVLDDAIKNATRKLSSDLSRRIATMDPTAFEWLIRALLIALGYSEVSVTKRSNDGGIDLRAKLVVGGIASIETAVQAKRTRSVGRPVVQNLRGSLTAHETGLLVTSGSFTDGAEEEARDRTKPPIALVNGARLVELMLDHKIGVRRELVSVYSLDFESLELEALQGRSEAL